MRPAIVQRISRRTYLDTPISPEMIAEISQEIQRLNQRSGLSLAFLEDAVPAFASPTKTMGLFSGVRSAIVLKGPKEDPDLAEKVGYFGEALVLTLTEWGLGTCWVAGTFDRKKIEVSPEETLLGVLTVGPVGAVTAREKAIRAGITPSRKSAKDRMAGYEDAPDWGKDGMEAVRLAPSACNTQTPTFCWENGQVTASVEKNTALRLIDLGIAKQNFAYEVGGAFPMGKGAAFVKA